jgi:hypothetical protein
VVESFSMRKMVDQLEEIYLKVTSGQ